MAMRVSRANSFALTVSADHLVGYYDLTVWLTLLEGFIAFLLTSYACGFADGHSVGRTRCATSYKTPWKWIISNPRRRKNLRGRWLGWKARQFFHSSSSTSLTTLLYSRIRLYSTKSFKSLGTLKHHKLGIQCLEFARTIIEHPEFPGHCEGQEDEDEDELSIEDKLERSRWLLVGSKDCRVSIWPLISFAK